MRRKNVIIRLVFLVVFLQMFVLTAFVGVSQGEETSAQESVHFVLVMDESRTMNDSDRNGYCQSAINMFVDMLPVKNVDVGVVGFGRKNAATAYDYTVLTPVKGHEQYVRQIHPFVNLSDSAAKDHLKNSVNTIEWEGSQTLIDAGLLAGIDMLSVSGAPDNKGCVVLLTDGEYKALAETGRNDKEINSKAVAYANEHGWQVYCIELDYANTADKRNTANQYLTSQITNRCEGDTYPVETAKDVSTAFMKIINSFYHAGVMDEFITDSAGYGHHTIEVPDLTSESNITIVSDSIKGVKLTHRDAEGNTEVVIGDYDNDGTDETSYNKNDFIVNRGKVYCNVKMIAPNAGTWDVDVLAAANTVVLANNIAFSDLDVHSEIIPNENTEDTALSKEDRIQGKISLAYHGQPIRRQCLGDAKAYLHVVNETTGEVIPNTEMLWNDQENQFEGTIEVVDLGKMGQLSVWTELVYANGEVKASDPVTIYTYNQPVTLIPGKSIYADGYVRTKLAPIAVDDLVENPDQDDLYFRIALKEGDISVALNDEKTAIVIDTGTQVRTYNTELLVWDADMGEEHAVRLPFTLNVLNHKMTVKGIPNQKLVKDEQLVLDLNEYFSDADQPDIPYMIEGVDEDILVWSMDEDGILNLTAKNTGNTKITISAVDDDGTEYSESFSINIVSLRAKLMRRIGIWGTLIVVLVVSAFVAFLIRKRNILMRGCWKLDILYKGKSQKLELDIARDVTRKKRYKTTLWKLIENYDIARSDIRSAEAELNQINLNGVYKEIGCKLWSGLKELQLDGIEVKKGRKVRLAEGTARLVIPVGPDNLTITITIQEKQK